MANSYLQFAFDVKVQTDEEKKWLEQALLAMNDYADNNCEPGEKEEQACKAIEADHPWMREAFQATGDPEGQNVDFDISWAKGKEVDEPYAWVALVTSCESGSPELLVPMLQAFLAKFQPTRTISFEWALTCDKMRPGAFGGGAVVVSAKEAVWLNTGAWAVEVSERVEAKLNKVGRKSRRGRDA